MIGEINKNISVGNCKLYVDDNNILHEVVIGSTDEKTAIELNEIYINIFKKNQAKINIILDLNKSGKPTPKARKIAEETLNSDMIGKVAIFGIHPVARVIASFVTGHSKKKDVCFFKTKEEAIKWINE